jgi:hypothetical protein
MPTWKLTVAGTEMISFDASGVARVDDGLTIGRIDGGEVQFLDEQLTLSGGSNKPVVIASGCPLRLGVNVGNYAPTPTKTLAVQAANGTTYYLLAHTAAS